MDSSRRQLRRAAARFAQDLRDVTQQLNDGVAYLSKAVTVKPCVGPREYKNVLSDLSEEVTDITAEVENLTSFTVDVVSLPELLGHCQELYKANRKAMLQLEAHLQEYGYQAPPGVVQEPEDPLAAMQACQQEDDDDCGKDVDQEHDEALPCSTTGGRNASSLGHGGADTRASDRHDSEKRVALVTPGHGLSAKPEGSRWAACRRSTPAWKGGMDDILMEDADEEDCEDVGRQAGGPTSMDISDDEGGHCVARVQPVVRGRPHCDMQVEAIPGMDASHKGMGASELTGPNGAAPTRATSRKAPRPSVDSRGSATPEAMMLSPSMAELLAKYNPPSDGDCLNLIPSAATGRGRPTHGSTPGSEEITAVMNGLAPFTARQQQAPVELSFRYDAPSNAMAPPAPPVAFSFRAAQQQPQQQPARGARPPAVEEDTCVLYQNLISASFIPSSLNMQRPAAQQQQQTRIPPAQSRPGTTEHGVPSQPAASRALPTGVAGSHVSTHHSERPTAEAAASAGAAVAAVRTDVMAEPPSCAIPPVKRSTTPVSVLRADRQQHDKQLAEKFAGLQAQLTKLPTPTRRSCAGALGGSTGGAAVDIAAAIARAKSPAPSRAAAEAAEVASKLVATSGVAATTGAVAANGGGDMYATAPRPNQPLELHPDDPENARVLSPLQPKSLAESMGAKTPSRGANRSSCLPMAPGVGHMTQSSTVVGATVRDSDVNAAGAAPKPAAPGAGRTPGRLIRGTPAARLPKPPGSPANAGPTMGHTIEAATPCIGGRIGAGVAAAAGPAELRASRAAPTRRSIAFPGGMLAAAGAAGPENLAAPSPARASRIAVPAAVAGAAVPPSVAKPIATLSRTPGPARVADAKEGNRMSFGQVVAYSQSLMGASIAVPQLPLEACAPAEATNGVGSGSDDDWLGFPLSRRAEGRGARSPAAEASCGDMGSVDEVRLAMPPSNSGTPTMTPSRGIAHNLTPLNATAAAAAGVGSRTVAGGISPATARLLSRAFGRTYEECRVPTGLSRIPAPTTTVFESTAAPENAQSAGTSTSTGGAAPVATAAALCVRPVSDEEWQTLKEFSQKNFPLDTLNSHLQAIVQLVSSRSTSLVAGSVPEGAFSLADLKCLLPPGMGKREQLLVNVLFQLKRLKEESRCGANVMYSLKV